MTEAITDPPATSCYRACYRLFFDSGIGGFQRVAPDVFSSRARARETRLAAGLRPDLPACRGGCGWTPKAAPPGAAFLLRSPGWLNCLRDIDVLEGRPTA